MELDRLLVIVRSEDPLERIRLRDAVTNHGEHAIQPMVGLLEDHDMRRFAIVVLEVLGRDFPEAAASLQQYGLTSAPDSDLAFAAAARLRARATGRLRVPRAPLSGSATSRKGRLLGRRARVE